MTNILPFRRTRDFATAQCRSPVGITGDLAGAIVGCAPHDFCLHIEFAGEPGLSIASAPIWCQERIAEAGFPTGPAVVLLTGRDIDGASAFATVSTADWRPAVLRLGKMPSYAFAERVHLLFWMGALQPTARRAMSAEIGRRIASYGSARRLGRIPTRSLHRPDLDAGVLTVLVAVAAISTTLSDGSPR